MSTKKNTAHDDDVSNDQLISPNMRIKTTSDQIADRLREAIFNGNYLPGDKLKEVELASWLQVSRTPLREALRNLEREGLTEFTPHKGFAVPAIDFNDLEEIYDLRMLIERYSIRKFMRIATEQHFEELDNIIQKMNDALLRNDIPQYFTVSLDFHAYFFKHCQSERLYSFFKILQNSIRLAQSVLGQRETYFYWQSLEEHKEVLHLLKQRGVETEKVLNRHIEKAFNHMKESLKTV